MTTKANTMKTSGMVNSRIAHQVARYNSLLKYRTTRPLQMVVSAEKDYLQNRNSH